MQAMVFTAPGQMRLVEREAPAPGPDEVVVAVTAAGICGSDLHGYTGASARRTVGVVMGHEVAGVVVEVGDAVDRGWLGSQVVAFPLLSCGRCAHCQAGSAQLCAERAYIGIQRDGGFAEQVVLPAANLVAIPAGLDPGVASLAEPAAVAMHAIHRAPDLGGAAVLVTGAGPIGLLITLAARDIGAARMVVNTEVSSDRRAVASQLGLEAVDPRDDGWLERIRRDEPDAFDVVFEAVGNEASVASALAAVRARGCVVLAAGWQTVPVALGSLVTREIEARGTFNFDRAEFEAAIELLGAVDAASLISHRVPLSEAPSAFERLAAEQGRSVKTVVTP